MKKRHCKICNKKISPKRILWRKNTLTCSDTCSLENKKRLGIIGAIRWKKKHPEEARIYAREYQRKYRIPIRNKYRLIRQEEALKKQKQVVLSMLPERLQPYKEGIWKEYTYMWFASSHRRKRRGTLLYATCIHFCRKNGLGGLYKDRSIMRCLDYDFKGKRGRSGESHGVYGKICREIPEWRDVKQKYYGLKSLPKEKRNKVLVLGVPSNQTDQVELVNNG